MLARIADKLILQPTRHEIAASHKTREQIPLANGHLEVWREHCGDAASPPQLFVLKFPGTGGRAERATPHPAEVWNDLSCEVWTVNPPGYGGSSGHATLGVLPEMAVAAFAHLQQRAGDRPIVVSGNSLGNLSALYVAARCPVDAMLLRNPPPLRQLIVGRHGWWSLGLARLIAGQVPGELCALANASAAICPGLFVVSGRDRTVPPRYQQMIIDAHGGENRVFLSPQADHATPISDDEAPRYVEHLAWLRQQLGGLR